MMLETYFKAGLHFIKSENLDSNEIEYEVFSPNHITKDLHFIGKTEVEAAKKLQEYIDTNYKKISDDKKLIDDFLILSGAPEVYF